MEKNTHQKLYMQIFIPVLFLINKNWKWVSCVSTVDPIHRVCFIHTTDYNSGTRINELTHTTVGMNLKLKDAKIKTSYCVIKCVWLSYTHNTVGTESKSMAIPGKKTSTKERKRIIFVLELFYILLLVAVTQLSTYMKLKRVHFTTCKLYLIKNGELCL